MTKVKKEANEELVTIGDYARNEITFGDIEDAHVTFGELRTRAGLEKVIESKKEKSLVKKGLHKN